MSKFERCFPIDGGLMLCEHHNGNWIIFPIYWKKSEQQKTPSEKEEVSAADE